MTREEAIGWLQKWQSTLRGDGSPLELAILKAVEALKQPEIIRCKDCEYWGEFPDYRSFCLDGAKSYDPEGFCHFARRREE